MNSCGYNGSGKSTTINLITRLYDCQKGEILINGHSIKSYSSSALRSHMIILLQQNARFDMTLKEWIALGDINSIGSEGNEDKLIEAVEKSDAKEIVNRLNGGLDCRLGPSPCWATPEDFLEQQMEAGERDSDDEGEDEGDREENGRKVDSGIATPDESDRPLDATIPEKEDKPSQLADKGAPPSFSGGKIQLSARLFVIMLMFHCLSR
jgi:hypothetical protein